MAAAAATLEQEVLKEDPVLRQKKELQQMMDRDYKVRGDTMQIAMHGCSLQPAVIVLGRNVASIHHPIFWDCTSSQLALHIQ